MNRLNIVELKPGLVFASNDPVSTESFAIAILKDLRKNLPFLPRLSQELLLFSNSNVTKLDQTPINDMKFIRHAIDIGLGEMPTQLLYNNIPESLKERLKEYI